LCQGIIIKYLTRRNIDCFGVELANVLPLDGIEGKIVTGTNALDLDENFRKKFKTLMLLDVIEHIEDDERFLKSVLAKYEGVTHLVLTVPARKEIWTNFDDFYRHFRRYDLKMTEKLINRAGFEVVDIRYVFNSIYLSILLLKKFRKDRPIKTPAPPNSLVKLLHRIIAVCFIAECWLMQKKLYGSSIFCVARKKE